MSDSLLVPITLEILLVNQALRGRDSFRTWRHGYDALREFCSPEPLAFDADTSDNRTGAFLHWTLPRSLRTTKEGTSTEFPLVPNRWLINRVSRHPTTGTKLKAWVLESDYLKNDAANSSYYLVTGDTLTDWNRKAASSGREQVQASGLSTGTPWSVGMASGEAYPVNIGKAFQLASWQEPAVANRPNLFLTAVAPGNLEFSAYVPFNEGVFSFFDDLLGDDQVKLPNGTTLSYQVIGWYSDPTKDILATGAGSFTKKETLADALAVLNWQLELPAGQALLSASSLYSGTAFGLRWTDEPSAVPVPDELETTRYKQQHNVAVANNSVDAFSTLVGAQLQVEGYPEAVHVIELLRAFHYDMLPLLDKPNGSELLHEQVRQEWFSSRAGGTRWTIVARQPAGRPAATATATELPLMPATTPEADLAQITAEALLLKELNDAQRQLDTTVAELTSLQWELHAAWWKKGYFTAVSQPADTSAAATSAIVARLSQQERNLLSQVVAKLNTIKTLQALVPSVALDTGEGTAFTTAIEAYATSKGLSTDKALKAIAQPRYWLPSNPTLVVSQVQPAEITDPDNRLTVRLAKQPQRSLLPNGSPPYWADSLGTDIIPPLPTPDKLPAYMAGLYQEFCLLDPTNAGKITAKVKAAGSPPPSDTSNLSTSQVIAYIRGGSALREASLALWEQQWHPLYLEWEVTYTHVPFTDPITTQANWRFTGTDYDLRPGTSSTASPQVISGRSLLSPSAQLTFGDRLKKFVGNAKADLQKDLREEFARLNAEVEAVDQWAFLSQELVGFNDLLAQRDTRTFRRPSGETSQDEAGHQLLLDQLTGYPGQYPNGRYDTPSYAQGLVSSVPAIAPRGHSALPFHVMRSGQLYLSHLVLYDKFGRKLELIVPDSAGLLDANIFPLIRDAALVPATNLTPTVNAPVQLPPRLLQPARLDLLLVDQQDTSKVLGAADHVNPVGGWLLVNHLDEALLLFAPDGTSLGELKLGPATARPAVRWTPPPHSSDITGIDAAQYPQLAGFAKAFTNLENPKSALEFRTLLQVIDSTLWTVDPLGSRTDQHLSVLVGRPLALVSLRLQFSLYGPPMTSADWPTPVADPAPTLSVRLGNHASREDGVIGYFEGNSYNVFNSVVAPEGTDQAYVQEIGPLGKENGSGNYLALPLDGAASITLLVDPRATIHATSGILPVKALELPRQFVDKALANMDISFRVGPLLTRIRPAPTPLPDSAPRPAENLSYLPLSEKKGTWSWWEKMAGPPTVPATPPWKEYGLAAAAIPARTARTAHAAGTAAPATSREPATLREGYLQFRASPEPAAS